ncbi:hypothetical protein GGR03_000036 [Aurantimonas endophytica]|uniref:Uncharacterized protein n=1 Tax=Aurantimonas endophytica TaxID=1522175 RepID=A0A7W6H991_9HYPH|nr:hypothetical protein [Aurantimonas endophytica]
MKLPRILRWWRCGEDAEMKSRRESSEVQTRQIVGDLRNQAQVMQSGSRRLNTMARTMALIREGQND